MNGGSKDIRPEETLERSQRNSSLRTQVADEDESSSVTWKQLDVPLYIVLGSALVLGVDSCMYPLEVIRTRAQSDNVLAQNNLFAMFRRIIRVEGPKTLFRGLLPTVCGSLPAQSSYYFSYEFTHERYKTILTKLYARSQSPNGLHFTPKQIDIVCHGLAGCSAELCAALFFLPADLVSQRLQVQPKFSFYHSSRQYSGVRDVLLSVYTESGVRGFYRGLGPHLCAFVPGGTAYWATYEATKVKLHTRFNDFLSTLFAACTAAFASVIVSNPADVIRTRVQTYEKAPKASVLLRKLWSQEGLPGFFKGIKMRLFTSVPGSALALSGYEIIKRWSAT